MSLIFDDLAGSEQGSRNESSLAVFSGTQRSSQRVINPEKSEGWLPFKGGIKLS